jgi:hypothetical protein
VRLHCPGDLVVGGGPPDTKIRFSLRVGYWAAVAQTRGVEIETQYSRQFEPGGVILALRVKWGARWLGSKAKTRANGGWGVPLPTSKCQSQSQSRKQQENTAPKAGSGAVVEYRRKPML